MGDEQYGFSHGRNVMWNTGAEPEDFAFFQLVTTLGRSYAGPAKYVLNSDWAGDGVNGNVALLSYIKQKVLQPGWSRKALLFSFTAASYFGSKVKRGLPDVESLRSIINFSLHLDSWFNQWLNSRVAGTSCR